MAWYATVSEGKGPLPLDRIGDVGRVGPGRQEIRLHWLPPIPVNVEDLSKLTAVVLPVTKNSL
jgi:hypothetical protein